MRAAVIRDGGRFEIDEVADPSPGHDELLVRVTACGLCGSDVKARAAMPPGTIMGHEFCGEVVGVGRDVTGWREGALVAVLPALSCGQCTWCINGYVAHCPEARLVGLGGSPGGFAEMTVITPAAAFALPPNVEPLHGALVEPLAVGLHTVRSVELQPGDDVLIVGAGAVGLTTALWARARGAHRITVVDPVESRRVASAACGATDVLAAVEEATPNSYDVVVECVGQPSLMDPCIGAARSMARVALAGVSTEPVPFRQMVALRKEISIRFPVYYTPEEFRTVLEAIASGRIDPAPLVGRTDDLAAVNEAFDALTTGTSTGKVLLEMR